jgi:uncharacterized integral membrane protein
MVLGLTGLALFLVFVLQNTETVDVEFLFWSFQTRRAVLLFLVLAVGIAIGWVLHGWPRRGRSSGGRAKDAKGES